MRHALILWPFLVLLSALGAVADARMSVLVDVLKLNEAAAILSDEGMAHAQSLNEEMLGGQGGAGWQQQVAGIYDPARMVEMVRAELEEALDGPAREAVIGFFDSDLGRRIVTLENEARVAIQDPEIETAARARFAELEGTDDTRLALIDAYIESGDMILRNVTSAMNANLQFLRGLAEGDAVDMSDEEILESVGADLEATTEDTTGWLFGYMLLAYHPLLDGEIEDYIEFSRTDAGQALNRALFTGFGKAYEDISYALGRAVALNMTAEEL